MADGIPSGTCPNSFHEDDRYTLAEISTTRGYSVANRRLARQCSTSSTERLLKLADYAERLYLADALIPGEARHVSDMDRAETARLRKLIVERRFWLVLEFLSGCEGEALFRFLERALVEIPTNQRVLCVHRVWVGSKIRPQNVQRILRVFRVRNRKHRAGPFRS